jgi:peptidoglycan hydrolase-like protein with peptidoglycan-binding domain
VTTTIAYDAIGVNVTTMPSGQHCGYMTGTGAVPWSVAQFVADPAAVRIDQAPVNTDINETADVLDVENGAATLGDIVPWVKAATINFNNRVRPGQRHPMVYCNQSTLTSVANTLSAAGVSCPIWIAAPGISLAAATAKIVTASGPYPAYGVQYAWNSTYDDDVFLTSWLVTVSGQAGDTIAGGSYGPAVTVCQTYLNGFASLAGFALLGVDGCFGSLTVSAVKAFQLFKKLTVDGVVGAATWGALVPSPGPSVNQTGTVTSLTTGGHADVTSSDGGWSWQFGGNTPGGFRWQTGSVHSDTTNSVAYVVSDDGGLSWHYAGTPSS